MGGFPLHIQPPREGQTLELQARKAREAVRQVSDQAGAPLVLSKKAGESFLEIYSSLVFVDLVCFLGDWLFWPDWF